MSPHPPTAAPPPRSRRSPRPRRRNRMCPSLMFPPCILLLVIASAAKQSRLSPRRDPGLLRCARNDGCGNLRHEPHHLLQPRDLAAIGRVEVGEAVELRAIEHRLQLAEGA